MRNWSAQSWPSEVCAGTTDCPEVTSFCQSRRPRQASIVCVLMGSDKRGPVCKFLEGSSHQCTVAAVCAHVPGGVNYGAQHLGESGEPHPMCTTSGVHLLYVTSVPGLSVYLHWMVPGTQATQASPLYLCVFMDPVGFPGGTSGEELACQMQR